MSAMGSLVAGVAHQVRNPLFGISSVLDAMEARFGDVEAYRKYIIVLRRETKRLTELMQELFEYGKPSGLELSSGSVVDVIAMRRARGRRSRRSAGFGWCFPARPT
jgi:signal transduction histidine kinase